jgi:hypothetical protein
MTHPIHRVTRFEVVGPDTLAVTFNAVTLDQGAGMLTRPNGADFDPATLHDWPTVSDELVTRARAWADAPATPRTDTQVQLTRR